ncbi:MAG: FecR domain-containing protein [Colwellia sp.]|nr:FecR domain-containing protein [Colwellia sp.]
MSNISQFHSKQRIQEQACLWISRMDRGLSTVEKQELTIWINQNKAHHKILLDMASYWDDLSVLNELSGLFPLEKNLQKPNNKLYAFAIAASFAVFSLLGASFLQGNSFFQFNDQQHLVQTQTFKTKIGEQASFSMSDGSSIQLNTNSIVTVDFSPLHRQLTLVRGEARFDVAKDKTRPFTVTAGEQSFTALGTIFNVQKDNKQAMELVVTEGKVLITQATESLANITKAFKSPLDEHLSGTLVISGEKSTITNNQPTRVTKISLDQVQRDLSWQQGILIFEGEPLNEVLVEVSRYTDIKFTLSDKDLAHLKVAGYFKAGDIEGLLASLHSNFNINAIHVNRNNILLASSNLP